MLCSIGEGPGCLKILDLARVFFEASLTPIFLKLSMHESSSLTNCSCVPPQSFASS